TEIAPSAPYRRRTGTWAKPAISLTATEPVANCTIPGDSTTWAVALAEAPWGSRLYCAAVTIPDCVTVPAAMAVARTVTVALEPGSNAPRSAESWPPTRATVPCEAFQELEARLAAGGRVRTTPVAGVDPVLLTVARNERVCPLGTVDGVATRFIVRLTDGPTGTVRD